ncbi:MAG: zinc ABC transporter substrate-binding protein [candidate division Zixibacteria bacterium]|nr:zinc ABC transporter substrate-binding protein [candidate division Zixibacteria bacterium]
MKTLLGMALLCSSYYFVSCSQTGKNKTKSDLIQVVATTGMIGDAAKVIAGHKALVNTLMGPGVDPHLYKATQGDVELLSNADLILYNGLHLEGKMTEALASMSMTISTVPVSSDIPHDQLRAPPEFKGHFDPHVWFDVKLWSQAVTRITQALVEADSASAGFFMARGQAYLDTLATLDSWIKDRIKEIPEKDRVMITAHDAFGYFGRAYGMEVRGLQGISTVAEYGLNDITSLVDLLVERKIKAVFVESSVPRRSIEAVVEGCRARGHEIKIGGELFSDALGTAGTPEGTYIGMVRHNVNIIVNALAVDEIANLNDSAK